jgi:hypothetical protein
MATLIIWAAIIAALVGGIIWLYTAGRSAGKAGIAADVASKTADNLRKQDQAGAEAAAEDVVERLRKGGF